MRRNTFAVVAAALAGVAMLAAPASAQLLTNGGFETGDCTAWSSEPSGDPCVVDSTIFSPGGPQSGAHWGVVQIGGPNAQAAYQTITGSGEHKLTGYYAGGTLNPSPDRTMFIELRDGSNTGTVLAEAKQTTNVTAGFGWTAIDLSGIASSGQVTVRFGHTGGNWTDATATHVDTLELTKVSTSTPTGAKSRRTHGSKGPFDIAVAVAGQALEPRQNAGTPQLVVTYSGTAPVVACGAITITNGSCTSASSAGNDLTINMSYNKNACVTVTVSGATFKVLTHEGNVSGDTAVNVVDLGAVKAQMFKTVDGTNFKNDVTCDGSINVVDLGAVKANMFKTASCP